MKTGRNLKVSFNGRLIDKIEPSETRFYAEGFEPCEVTMDELEENIGLGYAFSYHFDRNYRRTENFLASDVLVIDIDGGLKIDEALQLSVVTDFGSLLYTTPSHSIDHPRYRLVFALPRTITDPNELRFASRALAQRLGGDVRQTHAAGLFLGSTDCHSEQIGSAISHDFLEELIEDGRVEAANDSIANNRPTTARSGWRVSPTQSVTASDGSIHTLREFVAPGPVLCPFHRGTRSTAFVADSYRGRFLHCSKCQKTWWMSGVDLRRDSFRDFDDFVIALRQGAQPVDQSQLTPLENAMGIDRLKPKNVFLAEERILDPKNLSIWDLSTGVTFIKSPKGTGKTTFLADLLKRTTTKFATLEDYELGDDPESPTSWYSDEFVLLIGHRQALIRELCIRLGLNCYLDDDPNSSTAILYQRMQRYGICVDSLRKVEEATYDIVVIDEVEQVLAHFLAETLGEKRRKAFQVFATVIRRARQVILLDADLSWPTYKAIEIIKALPADETHPHLKSAFDFPIRIYLNDWKDEARSLNLYDNQEHLVHDLKEAILNGQRVFVTSNSKRKIDDLEQVVKQLEKTTGEAIPHVSITSANSKSLEIQDLILNIRSKIIDYQVVLSSPSLGTGVDITFNDGEQLIDRVFGFFEARITAHFEIDQHLARVRNPKQVDVWISPQRFNFETEFEVIVDDMLRSDLIYSVQHGFHWLDRSTLADKDPFLAMAALVVSKDRASKNNLKANFVQHKRDQGWTVNVVGKDDASAGLGRSALDEGRLLSAQVEAQRMLEAQVFNEQEFDSIKERIELNELISIAERARFDRTRLELFYRSETTSELIAFDDLGRARERILLFEALTDFTADPHKFKEQVEFYSDRRITRARVEILKDRRIGAALLHEILSTTPLFKDGQFLPALEYTAAEFDEFIKASRTLKRLVEGQFEVATRRDLEKKPIQHLDALLKLLGLRNASTRKQKNKGKTVYFYELDQTKFNAIESVVRMRAEIGGWESVAERYGLETFDRDIG